MSVIGSSVAIREHMRRSRMARLEMMAADADRDPTGSATELLSLIHSVIRYLDALDQMRALGTTVPWEMVGYDYLDYHERLLRAHVQWPLPAGRTP